MDRFDVAVLGSGLGGSTLATILARQGLSVLLLEGSEHPRFAIGESVVPEFGFRAKILAARYDVPELAAMGSFQHLRQQVSANCGIKRNFTFLWHAPDRAHEPAHSAQFQAMTHPLGPDSHVYRADLDAWLTASAVRRGATYRSRVAVDAIEERADGMALDTSAGRFEARFLVDATGHRSPLAQKFATRREPTLATDTRSIFTHMVGVGEIRAGDWKLPVPSPPDQGTLHHLFDGGWFWIIPFGNHSRAVNPTCSVGLTLDRRRHPDTDTPAAEEFASFVRRFPSVERQLAGARPLRGWVKTGRVQYESERLAGDRWCQLPHAGFFVDALFSGGMALTMIGVQEAAAAILDAFARDRFERVAFAPMEASARENVALLDRVVHGAFLSFRSPALFNAWFRVWAVANFHGSTGLVRLYLKHRATGDAAFLDAARADPYRILLGGAQPRVRALVEDAYAIVARLETAGEAETVDRLFALLAAQAWIPPQFHIADRERRHLASFSLLPLLSIILWGKRRAPPDIRAAYYDLGWSFFGELTRTLARESARSAAGLFRVLRDTNYAGARS